MNLYSMDVKICGTAYIKAENEEEARKLFKEKFGEGASTENLDVLIDEHEFDSPDLPEVSLSPAFTFYGEFDDAEIELAEENIPDEDEED